MKESDTPQRQDNTAKDAGQSKNKGTEGKSVATGSKGAPTTNETDGSDNSNNPSKMLARLKKHITVTVVVELLVLFVGIIVACIYSHQLDQMIRANTIAEDNFAESQRPYVWLISGKENVELLYDKPQQFLFDRPIKMRLKYQDYGLSPALVTRAGYEMHIKANAERVFGGSISWIPIASVLPPGKWDTLTAQSIENYTRQNEDAVIGDKGIAIYLVLQYTDVRKHAFETDICFYRMESGDLNYCSPDINKIRDCQKEACTK